MSVGATVYCNSKDCLWYSKGICEKQDVFIEFKECMDYEVTE